MDRLRSDGADGESGGQQFLSYADLEKHYGKSRVTLWRWVRAGLLPAPYEIGPNSAGFSSQEIRERDANLKRKIYGQEAAS
jgi:predicted DNA-binding transcriptional regulator AlpA